MTIFCTGALPTLEESSLCLQNSYLKIPVLTWTFFTESDFCFIYMFYLLYHVILGEGSLMAPICDKG